MPKIFSRLGLPVTTFGLALCASTLGCSASADDGGTKSRNNNGSGATANSAGGTDPGSGGATSSGGSGSSAGGTGSSAGGTGSSAGGTGSSAGGTGSGSGGTGVTIPPADTALPYTEDFEDSVAQGWIGGVPDGWLEGQALGAAWTIVADPGGSMVYQPPGAPSEESFAVGGDYRWTDQHLETKMKMVSGAEDAAVQVMARFSSWESYYVIEIRANRLKLRDRGPSTTVDVGEFEIDPPMADGETHQIGLSAIGTSLTVYWEGAPVITGTSSTSPAGGIAFVVEGAVVAFDDVTVTAE